MKRGFELGGKYSSDPIGSDKARGKDTFRRKSGRDPGLTPSEQHQKNELMRQFMKNPEGPGGHSEAYQTAWKRMFGRRTGEHSGQTEIDYPDDIGDQLESETCDDADCWCRQS